MKTTLKTILFTSVAVAALLGGFAYKSYIPVSHAAEEHGDEHGHEEGEESHDAGEEKHGHDHEDEHGHGDEGVIKLDAAQINAAGIKVSKAEAGNLAKEVNVPGKIVAAANRMAQIVPKVEGVVTEARKNLGDKVEKGEALALIESREMAEAVADYLAAKRAEELARTMYEREKGLWEKKITAEQDYLSAQNAHQEAKIRADLSHQKLHALGHDEDMIEAYGDADVAESLRFHEIRSPLAGRVIERELTLGEYVDTAHTAFTVADLSILWVETAIAPDDLPFVREGQTALISGSGGKAEGKLIFVSPAIDSKTRTAKAIIELDNKDGNWRAGDFANVAIATAAQKADIIIPKEAIQTIEGQSVVFVKTGEGFEKRVVGLGREDSRHVEIVSGISPGDPVAISGTFTLKAELGKAEAEHAH